MLGFKKAERAANTVTKEGVVDATFTEVKQRAEETSTTTTTETTSKPKNTKDHGTINIKFPKFEDPMKKIRDKKHRTNDEKYGKPLPDGIISRAVSADIEQDATGFSKEFCYQLRAGNFKDNAYFNKKDHPCKMVKVFYDGSKCGSKEYENNVMDLIRFINISRRAVLGKSFKDEKITFKALHDSYFKCKNVKSFDTMKLMAWAVPHSYVTGMFLDAKGRFDMIPKTDPTLFPAWNAFINQQDDIRLEVKALFLFNDKGVCPYVESHRGDFIFNRADNQHPEDDPPFESDDAADVDAIDLSCIEAQKANRLLDEQYRTAMENDKDPECTAIMLLPKEEAPAEEKPIDPSAEVTMKPNVEKEDVKIETLMQTEEEAKSDDDFVPFEASKDPNDLTFGELIADKVQSGKINPAVVASILSDANRITIDTLPKFIEDNNTQWASIPRLSKFTSYVKEAGKSVIYGADAEYLGLIKAQIINEGGDILRELRIDPCMMYGDTLRVVTTDNTKGDIRRETFIPISNKEIVTAAINGPLTKDQRKTIIEALPRCLGDFRTKYSYLDKVDMRGIMNPNTDIVGISFEDWRRLVTNISNILKMPKMPVCRMRVSEFKDPDNFQLVCDNKVLCTYPTGLLNEPSNLEALTNGFFITATSDSTKKDQTGYFYTGPEMVKAKESKK